MSRSHWLLLATLYVSQLLPIAFFFMAMPVILRDAGVALEQISYIYIIGFVWVFKFLWAPLVDRFRFGQLGHYRGWLILTQSGLFATVLAIATSNIVDHFFIFLTFAIVSAFFASTQDIAADAISCRLLPKHQHGLGSSVQLAGGLVGTIFGGGVVLMVYATIGWRACVLVIAAAILVVIVPIIRFDENDLKPVPESQAARSGFRRLFSFWQQAGMWRWAVLLVTMPVGITMAQALASPMLIDHGWSPAKVGVLLHIVAPVVGIAGGFLVADLMRRWGRSYILLAMPFLQCLALAMFLQVPEIEATNLIVYISVIGVTTIDVVLFAVLMTFMLGYAECGTEGSDFSVQHGVYSFVAFLAAAVSLQIAGDIGYVLTIHLCLVICFGVGATYVAYCFLSNKGVFSKSLVD